MEALIIILLVVAGVLVFTQLFHQEQQRPLQEFFAKHGLRSARSGGREVVEGQWRDRPIQIFTENQHVDVAWQARLRASAEVRFGLLRDLVITTPAEAERLQHASDLPGVPVDDLIPGAALHVQGRDPEVVRNLLGNERFAAALVSLLRAQPDARLLGSQIQLVITYSGTDSPAVSDLLDRTVQAAADLEEALRWRPGDEPPHAPPPRRTPRPAADVPPETTPAADAPARPVDRLVAELAGDGPDATRTRFSMDPEAARRKLDAFQLEDPAAFALELLQVAVLRGARAIDVMYSSTDLTVRFDGRPFTRAELEERHGALFADAPGADDRACQALAIGLAAALRLEPREITLRTGDCASGIELVLGAHGEEKLRPLDAGDIPTGGTAIRVYLGLLDIVGSPLQEAADQVRDRARFAVPAVSVNGERISTGLCPEAWVAPVPIEARGLRGACGLIPERAGAPRLWLQTDGVWITERPLPGATPGLVAVVESERFRKDLSRFALVEDEALAGAEAIVTEAEVRVLEQAADRLVRGEPLPGPAQDVVRVALRHRLRTWSRREDFAGDGEAAGLARAPAWPLTYGRFISLAALLEQCDRGEPLAYADLVLPDPAGHDRDETPCLDLGALPDPADRRFLAHLFRDRLISRTAALPPAG